MTHRSEWTTILIRANTTSVSLRSTIPLRIAEELGVSAGNSLVWTLATISGSVCAVVRGGK